MKYLRLLLCIAFSVVLLFVTGCGKEDESKSSVDNDGGEPSTTEQSESLLEEQVVEPILGEWRLIDIVQIENGSEHIIAKTFASEKSGSYDYFAFSSWFVITFFDEGELECSSSSILIEPYLEEYGSAGTWEKNEDSSYKVYAEGLLNSGIVPKPKDGYMIGRIADGILVLEGESEDNIKFVAQLMYYK